MNNNYNNNNNNDETINGKRMEMVKNSEHYDQQQQNQSILAENQILSATIKSITNHNNNNNTHSNHNSSSSSTGLSAKEIEKINQLMPSYLMNQHSKTNLTQTTISTMTTTTTTTTTLPSTSTISVIKLKNDKNNKHYSSNQTMNRSINVQNVVIGEQQRKLSTLSSINHRSYSNTKRDFQSSSSSNNGRKFQPYQKLSIISSTDKYQDKIADNQIVDDHHDDEEKNSQSLTKNDGKSVDSLLPDFLKSTSVQQQQQQSPIKQKLSMAINDEKILENSILAKDDIENDNEKNVNENININSDDDDDGHTKMTVKCSSLKQLSPLFLLMDCQNVIDNDNQNDLLFNNVDDNNGQQNQQQQQQTLLINDCNIDNNSMKPLLSSFMMNDNNHMVNENDGNSLDDNIATTTTTSKTTLWKSELMIYDDDDHIDKKHRNKDDDSDCHMEIITKKSSQSSIFANEDEELEEYIMSTISPSSSSTTTKTTTSSSLLYETIDEWLDYHEKEFWPKSMTKIFQQFSNDNSASDDNDETNWWQPIKSMLNDNIDCDNNKNHKEEESSTTTTTMMPEFWDHKRRMEWLTNLWNQNSTLGYMNDMFMMNSTDNNRQKNLNEELSLIIDLVQQQRQCQNQMTDNEKTTNSNEFNLTTIDSDGDVGGATIDSKLLNFYSFDDEMMQHFRKNFAEKMNNYHLNVNNNDNNSKCPNQIDKLDSKSEQNSIIDDNLLLPTTISSSSPSNDVINLTEMINNVLDSINRERQNEIEVDSNECFQTSLSIPIQSTGSSTSSLSSSFSNSDDLPSDFDVEKIPTSFLPKVQNNTTIESANVVEEIAPKPSGPFSKRYKLKSNANSADDNSKNDDNNYINGHVVTSNTNVDHSTFYSLRTSSYRHQQQNWYPTGSELQNDCSDYQGPHDDNIYYYGDDMDGGIMIDQNEATHFVESYGNDLYNYDGYLINMPKDDNNDLSMMNTNQLMSNNSFGGQNSFLTSSNDIDNLQPVDIKFKLENRYLVPDSDAKPVLKPCAFYLENACARLDCKFSHDLSSIPCKYYLEGACYKEEFCPFLHEKPKR
uniref:C3H1-type domain-containing protein n=1 Tax=Dermatophagoides pteronyssinus TaxID=6956 RepID=A0A6P6YG23_DERPT|nr:putative uncharacterized protein DDB_G0282133 [Dermatophagoides pteronyssinus]